MKNDPIMDAYTAWKMEPSEQNASSVFKALEPQIGTALHTFAPGMEDGLKMKAKVLTMQAMKTYNPKKGMHLKSYVYQQLQPLQREFGVRSNVVKVPERHIMERQRLTIAETELSDQLGRPPSVMELADYTHTPVKRITAIRAARMAVPESKTLDPETGSPTISQRENAQEVWSQYVYQSLDPTNQRIFEMVTGYGGTKTVPKQEIAKKLRISPSAVSQRIGVITKKLEEGLNLE